MHELITRLTEKAGISEAQAAKVLDTVKDFVKDKFPMMAGAVDNLLAGDSTPAETIPPVTSNAAADTAGTGSFLDKISDFIPGDMGQKAEDFAKQNLGGFFGDKK
jgi:hypothetical protein